MKITWNTKEIHRTMVLLAILPAIIFSITGCSTTSRTLADISNTAQDHYVCTYDGVRHDFIVELPENPEGSPLVIMLPGAGGTAESFRLDTGFHEKACQRGYTVVYVTGAPDPGDSISSVVWNYDDGRSGNDDIGFLKALAEFIQENFHTDPEKCFAAGFSNGAFMCHRLALEASDTFRAVIAVAGTVSETTWENRPASSTAGLLQIAGEKDDVIPKLIDGSAKYSDFPSIEEVISYYSSVNGLGNMEVCGIGKGSTLTEYTGDDSSGQVWFLYVRDGRHSWSAESVTGIDTNSLIIDFLDSCQPIE